MANKRGIEVIDGVIYLDGVEYASGESEVVNTFNKICCYGSSIECNPTPADCTWPSCLAEELGLTYGWHDNTKGVVNFSKGGGGVTWYAENVPADNVAYHLYPAFSCTDAEKEAAAAALVSAGTITQEAVDAAKETADWDISFDKSVLGQNADLYIFGTYGINDRKTGENQFQRWTDEYGEVQTAFTVHSNLAYDPRTIYGAYNRVLKALYNENPNAKVIILGQHSFAWSNQDIVNGIQRAVAERWQIPFLDWGNHLSFCDIFKGATNVTITFGDGTTAPRKRTIYNGDEIHPNVGGARLMGKFVAEWITHNEIPSLNERFTDITHE